MFLRRIVVYLSNKNSIFATLFQVRQFLLHNEN